MEELELGYSVVQGETIVKVFQILDLEFEEGIDESMRGETWVSVSLT